MKEARVKCSGTWGLLTKRHLRSEWSAGPPGTSYDLEFHPGPLLGFQSEWERKRIQTHRPWRNRGVLWWGPPRERNRVKKRENDGTRDREGTIRLKPKGWSATLGYTPFYLFSRERGMYPLGGKIARQAQIDINAMFSLTYSLRTFPLFLTRENLIKGVKFI